MKMARASESDIDAALKVSRILEDIGKRYMPSDDDSELEFFDRDDAEQCQKVIGMLLDATSSTSLFRVVFGMAVVLDPRNEFLDPGADTIEKHPKIVAALAAHTEAVANGATTDTDRLDFVLDNTAWIVACKRDGSILQYQLMTQDEDENYHVLHNERRFFNTERDAIDEAIRASRPVDAGKGDAS